MGGKETDLEFQKPRAMQAIESLGLSAPMVFSKGLDLANTGSLIFAIFNLENDNPAQWVMDNKIERAPRRDR
jgi:hypothetical protein